MLVTTKSGTVYLISLHRGLYYVGASTSNLSKWLMGKRCTPPVVGERLIIPNPDSDAGDDAITSRVVSIEP